MHILSLSLYYVSYESIIIENRHGYKEPEYYLTISSPAPAAVYESSVYHANIGFQMHEGCLKNI